MFAGLLVACVVVGSGPRPDRVRSRVLAFFGRISYGLYLCHLLVFAAYDAALARLAPTLAAHSRDTFALLVLRFALASGASVALAALSRATFEEFFLRRKDAPRLARADPATPASAVIRTAPHTA